jgi:hypothetical protein
MTVVSATPIALVGRRADSIAYQHARLDEFVGVQVLLVDPADPFEQRQRLLERAHEVRVLTRTGELDWPTAQDVAYAETAGKPVRWLQPPDRSCPACGSAALATITGPDLGLARCALCAWTGPTETAAPWSRRQELLLEELDAAAASMLAELAASAAVPAPGLLRPADSPPVRLPAAAAQLASDLLHDPLWRRLGHPAAHAALARGLGWLLGEAAQRRAPVTLHGPEAAALAGLLATVADHHRSLTGDQAAADRAEQLWRHVQLARLDRDRLGALVRAAWVTWARRQPRPKPSWLTPWAALGEPDREADRCIGEAIAAEVLLGRPAVHFDPFTAARLNMETAVAYTGTLGGGKTNAAMLHVLQARRHERRRPR